MKKVLAMLVGFMFVGSVYGAPMMSEEWAEEFCDAWNGHDQLMVDLGGKFMENDGGRGYKMLILNRIDCSGAPDVQITLEQEDGLAICVDSGLVVESTNYKHDYKMRAKTKNWLKMGTGDLGPAGAMMTGRLKFEGPKMEAMKFMGPFKNFLLLIGEVGMDTTCP